MNKILFKILFIIFFSIYYTFLCFAQNYETEIIKDLHQNPKINHPEEVLKDYIEGKQRIRVVVKLSKGIIIQQDTNFKDISSRKKLKEAVKRVQDSVINCLGPDNIRITNRFSYIYAFGAEVNLRGLKQLTEINNVISIRIAMVLRPNLAQGIPLMSAWTVRSQYNGENIAIAVCDSGIDYTHPMLGGGRFPNSKVIGGYDFVDRDADPIDTDGHGTACAGIAAGDIGYQGDYIGGVAYNAKLYALRVSNFSDLIESWEWCIDHKNDDPLNPIMIISTSLSAGYFTSVCDSDSDFAQTAANVHAAGIALFASSGNEGYCDGIACPACISDVISVGAVYDAEWGTRDDVADFRGGVRHSISQESCIGKYEPNYWREDSWACEDESTSADIVLCSSNTATFLDILAPGTDAYTTGLADGFVENFGGTSAACAYAAGAAACLQSAAKSITGSFLSPDEVRALLTSTGDLITDTKEEHIGITKPRINLRNAINAISGDDLPLGYAVDNMSLTWTTGGDADWFGQTDENRFDGDAAHSAYGQNSWIETTVTGPGVLSFYWEATEFDRLKLYIDGMKQAESNLWRSSRWVGVIESGSHILRWISTDAGWLDKVFFEAIIPLDEALDTTDLVWKTGGDADWFGHGCGIYYDGDVAHSAYGQSSWIETTVTGPGVLSFYWKVLGSASYIRFYIDDVEHTKTNSINWRQRVLGIPSGSHTLKWSHDSITGAGCLDRVKFTTDNPSLDKALDNKYLEWRTGGDVGWFGQTKITFDNEGAAQSGTIMDKSQNSWIETMVTGPGILSFYEKVTGNYSDQLVFSIDGNSVDVFQGLSDWYWKKKAYSISPGTHTLILNFTTDSGSGTAWMDRVGFTAAPAIVLTSPIGEGPFKHRSLVSIKWVNSEDVSSNIRIELYKGGSLHHTITTNTENDGYYEWCVPTTLPVGKDYRIKVSSISDPSIYAASDNDFIIEETFSSSLGGYLILEGTDDFLEALDHPELNLGDGPGESFTIEAWYYAPGIYGFGSIIEKPNSYFLRFGREWDIFTLKVRSSIIYHLEGVTGGIHCRWPPHPTGWHHVALVGGNGWVRLFFDGEILTEREYSGSLKNSTENLRIGEGVGRAFDEIRISDVARYNEAPFIPPTSPFECDIHTLALWRFEETGGATRFHDACGEDNTLYMGNTAPVSSDDSVSLDEDSILSGALSASDANGDSLTYCIVTNGALGTVTITDVATGAFTL
ncbi:MAG: S8 family serine peptidase [bacterium]